MISDYDLEKAFADAKSKTKDFIERFNDPLPTERCPGCDDIGHCPGLPCPVCGYEHQVSWVISLDTEYGYDVVEIRNRKKVIACFNVPAAFR
jgi:hypothetical protein